MIDVEFQRGLHLPEAGLWLDPGGARPFAFVSHAHADHFARHRRALCSTATAALLRARFGMAADRLAAVDYHAAVDHGGFRLRLLPAGHIHGSAMLHVTRLGDGATLLYTGDFKVRPGRAAEPVHFLSADLLIIETTFGLPRYVFPPALEVESRILGFVHDSLHDGAVPVLLAYSLGKAQEALALLAAHRVPTRLHPAVAGMTAACRDSGLDLPEPRALDGPPPAGHVVIAPPNAARSGLIRSIPGRRTAMLSGWALTPGAHHRYRVDEAIPLSDHADHPGLLECVRRVQPQRVLTVHGFAREFAAELRARGIDAWSAAGNDQLELGLGSGAHPLAGTAPRPTAASTRHPRPVCPLAGFSDLCRRIGETRSRSETLGLLADYLRTLDGDDLAHAARWLAGTVPPQRLGGAMLGRALIRLPGVREDRYRALSNGPADAARTARILLEEARLDPRPLNLRELGCFLAALAETPGAMARIDALSERLRTLHPAEGETLVRLLAGDLRGDPCEGLVEAALARAFDADAGRLSRAHMLTGDLGETARMARDGRLDRATLRPLVPLRCMLASALPDAAAIVTAMKGGAADGSSATLWLEPIHRGIRAQLHKVGDRAALFARDLRSLDGDFPELVDAARRLAGGFVVDGTLLASPQQRELALHPCREQPGRSANAGSASGSDPPAPVRFIAFDLLWHDGEDLLDRPLAERRTRLERLATGPPLELVAVARADDESAVEAALESARAAGHEGLIAKDPSSPYTPGGGASWLELRAGPPAPGRAADVAG